MHYDTHYFMNKVSNIPVVYTFDTHSNTWTLFLFWIKPFLPIVSLLHAMKLKKTGQCIFFSFGISIDLPYIKNENVKKTGWHFLFYHDRSLPKLQAFVPIFSFRSQISHVRLLKIIKLQVIIIITLNKILALIYVTFNQFLL